MRTFFILIVLLFTYKTEAQSSVLKQADSLYVNGNFSKAIAAYKTHNNQSQVYDRIAKAYIAIGNYDLALQNYQASIKANPDDALVKYDYAKLLSKTKKFKQARIIYNDLIAIDENNPNYHYELGLVSEKLKDTSAISSFRLAYDLDQTHQKAIYKIAKYFLKKRNHDLALTYIDKGLESYKTNVELISLKAQNYYIQKYFTKALSWFERLIELGESSEFIHDKLSKCYADNYDYKLAIEQCKIVQRYNPYNADSVFSMGTYYQRLQDFVNAEKYIKQAIQMKDVPLDQDYQLLGVVLNRQDKHKEAIDAFQKSLQENPENIRSEFFIISTKDTYYADIDAKIKLYKDFIEKYPESFYSRFAQRRISELKEEKFLKAED